jgi:hypothetical protein
MRVDTVRADVAHDVCVNCEHAAVAVRSDPYADALVARVARRDETLGALLHPFQRPPHQPCHHASDGLLRVHVRLEAEAATDVRARHADLVPRYIEHLGEHTM